MKEKKRKKPKVDTVIEVDFRRLGFLAITVIMCLMSLAAFLLYFRSFLEIKKIELEGVSTYYSRSQLIEAADVDYGDKLYSINTRVLEKTILENCPYIESVSVKQSFPNKLVLSVVEKTPQWYIEITGDFYVLDTDLTVLGESTNESALKISGLTRLELPAIKRAVCGELPVFGEDELEVKRTCELINIIRQHPLKLRLTSVDISNRFAVSLTVRDTYEVFCGDMSQMRSKLDAVEKILTVEFCSEFSGAEIDASSPATVGVIGKNN